MSLFLALRSLSRLLPWQAWAVAGVLSVAAVWHWKEVRGAVAASYSKLEATFAVQEKKADAAELDVLRCPEGKWNRETSKCEP